MTTTENITVARIVECMVFWYLRAKELEAQLESARQAQDG